MAPAGDRLPSVPRKTRMSRSLLASACCLSSSDKRHTAVLGSVAGWRQAAAPNAGHSAGLHRLGDCLLEAARAPGARVDTLPDDVARQGPVFVDHLHDRIDLVAQLFGGR